MDTFSNFVLLSELKLGFVELDLAMLEQVCSVPILGVRKLEYSNIRLTGTDRTTATLCSFISRIFPNVQQLTVDFVDRLCSMRLD